MGYATEVKFHGNGTVMWPKSTEFIEALIAKAVFNKSNKFTRNFLCVGYNMLSAEDYASVTSVICECNEHDPLQTML